MSKKIKVLIVIMVLAILGIFVIGYKLSLATTTTTLPKILDYKKLTTEEVTPWLDKVGLFFTTFAKQAGELARKVFTSDFIGICLKFLKGIWEFIVGIFKMFFDLLSNTFAK
jgi:predicted PurR-regulated permease PerM